MNTASNPDAPLLPLPTPAYVPVETEQAWREYQNNLDIARNAVLAESYCQDPLIRAQGLYLIQMLQTFGFSVFMAPRQAYPNFYFQNIFLPFESGFGAPCPDFSYHWTFIDGARTYRIWGKTGTTRWIEFQMIRSFWGDKDMKNLGVYDFDNCTINADGTFEIIASPREHGGNWIKLDPTVRNITVITREAWYDWENEKGMEVHIECLDRCDDDSIVHSEAEMNRRILAMGRLARADVDYFIATNRRIVENVGINNFYMPPLNHADDVGGNPRASYLQMVYELEPGEALLIETEVPAARYWSVHMSDIWWQTADYAHHPTSLNGHQVHIDEDGKCRIVISFEDPGVHNWLTPVGATKGVVLWRWYLADRHPCPSVVRMSLNQVRQHLPATTPAITAEQRQDALVRRRRSVLGRYGF